ncbi:hypothetical protein C1I97_12725 [Streptomyces sp. NTH33]|uniref:phosphatidylserine/phosphatidylglycerophosphate/ cardiolipin synthase family protein n=1 Tax=Streptomyces sp. NTH33 TaxID=1735453 RepID=UPI000DA8AE97|nr:phosphatidylserine/phosphatidylglycerophosphate/cardiolipin synthase family protein [Streptomyces sp. NTH33]PZH12144.1 hypothetical protein C1I97_12725 [Streptomyces sp. NTH33]
MTTRPAFHRFKGVDRIGAFRYEVSTDAENVAHVPVARRRASPTGGGARAARRVASSPGSRAGCCGCCTGSPAPCSPAATSGTGSHNLDESSLRDNDEAMLRLEGAGPHEAYRQNFESMFAVATAP